MVETTDRLLWEAWRRDRDANAFAELLTRHSGMVYATCIRVLANEVDAEDAAQECFFQLMDARITVQHSLAPWLHTVATRRALDIAKARGRRSLRDLRYAESLPGEDGVTYDDVLALLDEIVEGLTEDYRTVIVERFFRGRKLSELAEALEISESTVRYRIDKGVEAVRARLKERGVVTMASSLTMILSTQLSEAAPVALVAQLGKLTLLGGHEAVVSSGLIGGMSLLTKSLIAITVLIAALVSTKVLLNQSADTQPAEVRIASSDEVTRNTPADLIEEEEEVTVEAVEAEGKTEVGEAPEVVAIAEAGFGKISGRVVSSFDGKPVTEFKILVVNGEYSPEMDGDYKFLYPPKGNFTAIGASTDEAVSLRVRAPGYWEAVVPVDGIRSGETIMNVVVSMEPESILEGYVLDRRGIPVEGATIYKGLGPARNIGDNSQEDPNVIALSDSEGRFVVGGLLKGDQTFSVHQTGYSPDTVTVYVDNGNNTIQLVLGDSGVLEGIVTLEGYAYLAPLGIHYAGSLLNNIVLEVEIYGDSTGRSQSFRFMGRCDENGHFRITGIPAGRGTLSTHVGVGEVGKQISTEIEIEEGMTTEVDLVVREGTSSVEGYMMSDENEVKAGHINLYLDAGDHSESVYLEVGDDGFYRVPSLPPGIVSIRFRGDIVGAMDSRWTTAVLSANEDLNLNLYLHGGATLRCYISNPPAGKEIRVCLVHEGIQIPEQMDGVTWGLLTRFAPISAPFENGVITISGVEYGSYTLVVIANSYFTNQQTGFSPMQVVTVPVVIRDETELDVDVSF